VCKPIVFNKRISLAPLNQVLVPSCRYSSCLLIITCACVCLPLYVNVKMCSKSDKYLANISQNVTTSCAVYIETEIDVRSVAEQVYCGKFLVKG